MCYAQNMASPVARSDPPTPFQPPPLKIHRRLTECGPDRQKRWVPRDRDAFRDIVLSQDLAPAYLNEYGALKIEFDANVDVRENTKKTYLVRVKQLLWFLQSRRKRIEDLDHQLMTEFFAQFADRSRSNRVQLRAAMRAAAERLWLAGRLKEHPAPWFTKSGRQKAEQIVIEYLDDDELEAFVRQVKALQAGSFADRRDSTIMLLLVGTGVRVNEVLKLHQNDVRLDESQAPISFRISQKGGAKKVVELKKDGQYTDMGRTFLDWWWFRQEVQKDEKKRKAMLRSPTWKKSKFVFASQRGGPLTYSVIQSRVPEIARQAGIRKHVHPHVFRHSYAMLLRRRKVPIDTLKEVMSHKHISSTLRYVKPLEEEVKSAEKLVDDFIANARR
jgi:site-specific recombinase XerD